MAAKAEKKQTKADFVRSVGPSVSAKEVVAKAKAAGIALTDSYVYNVRSSVKTAANKAAAKPRAATKTRVAHPVARSVANTGSVESLLKAVAAEIGLGRAFDILVAERARVVAAIGA